MSLKISWPFKEKLDFEKGYEKLKMMKSKCLHFFVIFVLTFSFMSPVKASPEREFLMACTYGTLAGTLVGVASLAFTDKPGENLRNVARGASLGLYLGILLGLYVIYVVPAQLEEQNEAPATPPDKILEEEDSLLKGALRRTQVFPLLGRKGEIDGWMAQYQILSF
ncbi:MAG: hypothetical protein D6797_07575 [Bdellovibrio sp.]|nr:MAG: hypothetical protein D6797_07575 [Bdellovibrio sp.]